MENPCHVMAFTIPENPFEATTDPDRHQIWDRLMRADSEAFVAGDWELIEKDFDVELFEGVRCQMSANPDDWRIAFPDLASYRDNWLKAAKEFATKKFVSVTPLEALYVRSHLAEIEVAGARALAHKQFYGEVALADGSSLSGRRQTIYRLHKQGSQWRIVGFLGYLPLP